jgi:hypothetical protein
VFLQRREFLPREVEIEEDLVGVLAVLGSPPRLVGPTVELHR